MVISSLAAWTVVNSSSHAIECPFHNPVSHSQGCGERKMCRSCCRFFLIVRKWYWNKQVLQSRYVKSLPVHLVPLKHLILLSLKSLNHLLHSCAGLFSPGVHLSAWQSSVPPGLLCSCQAPPAQAPAARLCKSLLYVANISVTNTHVVGSQISCQTPKVVVLDISLLCSCFQCK